MGCSLFLLLTSLMLGEGHEIAHRAKRAAFATCEVAAKSCVGHFADTESYPNIAEGFKGYDIILGNLILGENDDNGLRSLIFDEAAERSGPVRFNNIAGHSLKQCTKNFESTFINNVDDFLESTVRTDSTDGSRRAGQEVIIVGSLEGKVHGNVNANGGAGFEGEVGGGINSQIKGGFKAEGGLAINGELSGGATGELDVGAEASLTAGGKVEVNAEANANAKAGVKAGWAASGPLGGPEGEASAEGSAGFKAGGSAEAQLSGTAEVKGNAKVGGNVQAKAGAEGSASLGVNADASLAIDGQVKLGVDGNFNAGVKVGAEGGGGIQATATFPPLHQSLSSNSKTMMDIAQKIESKEQSITRTWTQCSEYSYHLQAFSPPSFHSGFLKGLTYLNRCWKGHDERECAVYFIQRFGTHFVLKATFGARKVTTRQFNHDKAELVDTGKIEQCSSQDSENSLAGLLTWGSKKESCGKGSKVKEALVESGFEKETTYTIGKGLEGWGEGTVPRMIKKTLAPLSDLFQDEYMEGLNISYSAIRPWLQDKILSYCDLFKTDHHCNFVVKRPFCPSNCGLAKCSAGLYTGPLDRQFLPHGRGTLTILKPKRQQFTLQWNHGCQDAADGVWSGWSEWESCQGSCEKGGKRSRTRSCTGLTKGSKPCLGRKMERKQCTTAEACSGILSSPNFSSIYPNNYEEREVILVKEGRLVQIKFVHFDVAKTFRCRGDYLKITDGDGTILMDRTCGFNLPPVIFSRTHAVFVTFHTDGQGARTGWKLEWKRAA